MKVVRPLLLAALVAGGAVAWVTLDDAGRRAFEAGPASAWSWTTDAVGMPLSDAPVGALGVRSADGAPAATGERAPAAPAVTSTRDNDDGQPQPSMVRVAGSDDPGPLDAPTVFAGPSDDVDPGPATEERADTRADPDDVPLEAVGDDEVSVPSELPAPLEAPTPTPAPSPPAEASDTATDETPQALVQPATLSAEAFALLAELNESRGLEGLPPLQPEATLQEIAAAHAADLAARQTLSHTGSDGRSLVQRLEDGHAQFGAAGENVARGRGGAAGMPSVAQAFLASPIHRGNVLNEQFGPVGIGVVTDAQGYSWITVVFTD